MADVAEMKVVSQGNADNEAATKRAAATKGAALAVKIVGYINGEVQAEQKRSESRMRFVRSILALDHEGHTEFRKQLQQELVFLSETMDAAKNAGALAEDESRHGGYSAASFRVMVSNFRTISAACELGWKLEPDTLSWEDALSQCRNLKKAQAAQGVTVAIEGTRAAGAGRKVASALAKVQTAVSKLSRKDKMTLCVALAQELGLSFDKASNKS